MAERPHDMTDLYLAPVVLGVEARLEELGTLSTDDLNFELILETNIEPQDTAERRKALIETVRRRVELHGWSLSLNERGLAVSHDDHTVVLGLPDNLREYLRD
ncbi:hypothetical protein [Agromyces bauzanensis]|uniref:Uncharacterized protein n=1 Tax=Agromyces bauzanensis TaxID=1308924 RepID=A0A917UNA6_9MICO|nr:hypothetical protein [Agromyces bauzanensis]GGJ69546.1 hypothetical protein GCM10011372_04230 [Agromyces bauzanensis]